jgi:hypothetical protein
MFSFICIYATWIFLIILSFLPFFLLAFFHSRSVGYKESEDGCLFHGIPKPNTFQLFMGNLQFKY